MRDFEVTVMQRVSDNEVRVYRTMVENVRSAGVARHRIGDRLIEGCWVQSVVEVR